MTNFNKSEDSNNFPKHICLVFNKCLLFYTPVDKLERELFKICEVLLYKGISNLTVFNLDGYLNEYIYKKYSKCNNQIVECIYSKPTSIFNCVYLYQSNDFSNRNHTLMYFINRINNKLVISAYKDEIHSKQKGLLLILIDRTHSHIKILNSKNNSYTSNLNGISDDSLPNHVNHEGNWVREKTKKGLTVEYMVPNESSITQPKLQELVCTFDGVITPLPDLIISLRLSLSHSLLFIINYLYCFLSRFYGKVVHNNATPGSKPDFNVVYSAFMVRIGNVFRAGMSIVHSFGPSGIQPWFLSESEIYESMGIDANEVNNCIKLFTNTVRRRGR